MTKNEQIKFKNECMLKITHALEHASCAESLQDIYEYALIARLILKYLHEMTDFVFYDLMVHIDEIIEMTKEGN